VKPFTVLDVEQRSEAWKLARLGRLTSSKANDMLAKIKSGEAAARRNLRVQLALERVVGRSLEKDFQSQAMSDGVAREADALRLYEAVTGNLVRKAGFLMHPEVMAGASLDAYVGDFEIVVEAKSPLPATHLEYVRTGIVPKDYADQILHQLWITGASAADFISYNPDFPERLQLKVVRVARVEAEIEAYTAVARAFLAEVERDVLAIQKLAAA